MSKIEQSVIIKKLLMNILVPPKIAKRVLAGHFGVQPTTVDLTEELLLEYGRQCYEAGAGRSSDGAGRPPK